MFTISLTPSSVAGASNGGSKEADEAITMKNGTFAWGKAPDCTPALHTVTLHVPKGALCAVVGSAGSGKSSLLAAMLGEMACMRGHVQVHGSVAFAAQVRCECLSI